MSIDEGIFLRVFPHPNLGNKESGLWVCPFCLKNDDKPVTLAPVYGTRVEGIEEARQVHADCFEYAIRWSLKK